MSRRGERGVSDSLQWAILLPVVLLTILGMIQVGLWAHGRTVAAAAAVAAAERAALYGGDSAAARAAASRIADHGGLIGVAIEVTQTPAAVVVRVRGRMPTFFDLGQTRVDERATRPRERVTRP